MMGRRKHRSQQSQRAELATTPEPNKIVAYVDRSSMIFDDQIRKPLVELFGDIREIRNAIVISSDFQTNHPDLVEKMNKIDDNAWAVMNNAKHMSRRLKEQAQKVKKVTISGRQSSARSSKSVKRQEAGKLKAVSLKNWLQDCASAREALKKEGYQGSYKVKKGNAVYEKAKGLEKARVSGILTSAGSGAGSAGAGASPVVRPGPLQSANDAKQFMNIVRQAGR